MGIVFQVHMEDLKRTLHLVPPVSVVTYYEDEVQPRKQILDQLGFALRLTGNAAGNHLLVNGKKYYAAYPHILLKKPGEIHEDSGGAVHSSFFFAYSPAISENVMNVGKFDEFIFSELPQHWETFEIFRSIQTEVFHLEEFGAIDRIDMLCWRLVQEFLLAYRQKTNPQPYRFRQILKIISYLQLNFKKPPDWRMLARQNGLSYRSFQRQWQQSGLPPPNQYVTHLRMEEAKRLLTKTAMPIADIADELHYCDCAWFCAVFRRATGVTPLQYRHRFSG